MAELSHLRNIMRTLRDPVRGCPWDREQDFLSIVPHTLEEACEVAAAIEDGDWDALPGELGDLLFQIVFYCQLGEELGAFDFDQVAATIADKLTRRHPHVFGDAAADDAADVRSRWESGKAAERRARLGAASSELDDVPLTLPALSRAAKIQRRAARVGFDWPDRAGPRAKIDEELAELDAARGQEALSDELGDLLFATVNLARHLEIDAEQALRRATDKFERRFRLVEQGFETQGQALGEATLATLEAAWERAKQQEKERVPKHP